MDLWNARLWENGKKKRWPDRTTRAHVSNGENAVGPLDSTIINCRQAAKPIE